MASSGGCGVGHAGAGGGEGTSPVPESGRSGTPDPALRCGPSPHSYTHAPHAREVHTVGALSPMMIAAYFALAENLMARFRGSTPSGARRPRSAPGGRVASAGQEGGCASLGPARAAKAR